MPRTRYDEPDDEEGGDYDAERDYDPDDPDTYPEGVYVHGDERAVVPCPHCKAEIDEESEQCPKCGAYLSEEDAPTGRGLPGWVVVLAVALLAAFALSMFR
jgi:uncharacterized paraquat-inducible protein A